MTQLNRVPVCCVYFTKRIYSLFAIDLRHSTSKTGPTVLGNWPRHFAFCNISYRLPTTVRPFLEVLSRLVDYKNVPRFGEIWRWWKFIHLMKYRAGDEKFIHLMKYGDDETVINLVKYIEGDKTFVHLVNYREEEKLYLLVWSKGLKLSLVFYNLLFWPRKVSALLNNYNKQIN